MIYNCVYNRLLLEREVVVYCDLHGHSRKQNVFIYGCENRINKSKRLHERVFPAMLSKNCPDKVRCPLQNYVQNHLSSAIGLSRVLYIWEYSALCLNNKELSVQLCEQTNPKWYDGDYYMDFLFASINPQTYIYKFGWWSSFAV